MINVAWVLKITGKKFEINESTVYKKTTFSSIILLILLKNIKNKTKGETCVIMPNNNNNTNLN